MFDKLIELIINFIHLFRVFVTVPQYDRGCILRLGKFKKVVEPGPSWVIPLGIDVLYPIPNYVQTMIVGPQSLVTTDNIEVVVSTLISFYVKDPEKFLVTIEGGDNVIEDTTYGVVSKLVMGSSWSQLREDDVPRKLTERMRANADKYGVGIKSAQLVDLTRARSIRLVSHPANKTVTVHSV